MMILKSILSAATSSKSPYLAGLLAAIVGATVLPAAADNKIEETLILAKGWSGVYLESTPENANCEDFFADMPDVLQVGAYLPAAYETTAQYDDEGNEIEQKPVSFYVWERGQESSSTLQSLRGGTCFLVYTTNACSKTFRGVPCTPNLYWRECSSTSTNELANIVAASLPADADVQIKNYFKEGPAGSSPTVWEIYTGANGAPAVRTLKLTSKPKVTVGKAYVMTATRTMEWPGVIGVSGVLDGLNFTSNGTDQAGFFLSNNSATERAFRLEFGPGADGGATPELQIYYGSDWQVLTNGVPLDLTLEAGAQLSLTFAIDRTKAANKGPSGGLLAISDLGGTKMRVRVPVSVEPRASSADQAAWPCGFWIGTISMNLVNYGTNTTLLSAGGKVQSTVLLNWSETNRVQLLQRVSFGGDPTTGRARFFRRLDDAKAALGDTTIRRLTCVLLDPDNPVLSATPGATGTGVTTLNFNWTVDKHASANPMRHSWHPDHDGVTYKTDGSIEAAPDGDNLSNYTYPVKPELFSIGNKVTFGITDLTWTPDETLTGKITWELTGLKSALNGRVFTAGEFVLKRVSANSVLE